MTSQAKICVSLDQHFGINRAVRLVTPDTAFAHCPVLEHNRPGLFAMAGGAGFVQPRHGESSCRFENVATMRVVTLHTIHMAFDDRMMLWQIEFSVRFQMALETRCRVLAGIDDGLATTTAGLNVQTARSVTGFTTTLTGRRRAFEMHTCMRTRRKLADVVRVAIKTNAVANVMSAGDFGRRHERARRGTGVGEHHAERGNRTKRNPSEPAFHVSVFNGDRSSPVSWRQSSFSSVSRNHKFKKNKLQFYHSAKPHRERI